jgi:hypothetical protein
VRPSACTLHALGRGGGLFAEQACLLHLQGALILKILRGKYPALTGYSPDISDLVKRCLTQVRGSHGMGIGGVGKEGGVQRLVQVGGCGLLT